MALRFQTLLFASLGFAELACNALAGIDEPQIDNSGVAGATAGVAGALPGVGGTNANAGSNNGGAGATAGAAGINAAGGASSVKLELQIDADENDALWVNGTDERLYFGSGNLSIEVGADDEASRAGLRFVLPVPPGSKITSARVELTRSDGDAGPTNSVKIQIFDAVDVAPFNDGHVHSPEQHVSAGLWSKAITGIWLGEDGKLVGTPDLKELVQHLIDKPEWKADSAIGFVLLPDKLSGEWVAFSDSVRKDGTAARLILEYSSAQ